MPPTGWRIGIDLGTGGCRACALDPAGQRRAFASAPWTGPFSRPETWWHGLRQVLGRLVAQIDPAAVTAIAVDGTSATLLVTDAVGRPLAPALTYDDARATREAQLIARAAPATCAAHGATSALAKLLWFAAHGDRSRIAHALSQADWIAFRLGAPLGASDENNVLKLGWDPISRRWPAWLQALGVPSAWLPVVHPPGTPLGTVDRDVAKRFGLSPAARIAAGTTDSVAATLATGAGHPGEAVTSLGSTLVLKVFSARPVFDPTHGVYSHRLGDDWLSGGASNTGGAVLCRFFDERELDRLSRRIEPQRPTGLDYYPLLRPGERFPVADPRLSPRLTPRPADPARFLQGLLESMARIEAEGYRLLAALGAPYPRRVFTTGGGAVNPAWTRIRERALGVAVIPAPAAEAACGAARLAREAADGT